MQDCWGTHAEVVGHTCKTAGTCMQGLHEAHMQDCWNMHAGLLGDTHRNRKYEKHDSDILRQVLLLLVSL